ncbi:hypothetical protein B0H11DRAFT_2220144 [Mycena galericulata]|nr:hypothetical protein B0H11DRAFT_2220144 [Mycena galericulata]
MATQTVFPLLIAIDDFQALAGRSMYRNPQRRFIRPHHLGIPRLLLVEASTGASPPSLMIISPIPCALTFPITHNLASSPYSSPSNSPFEPDLRVLAHHHILRLPHPSTRPRGWCAREAMPQKGDLDYVKRPENALRVRGSACAEFGRTPSRDTPAVVLRLAVARRLHAQDETTRIPPLRLRCMCVFHTRWARAESAWRDNEQLSPFVARDPSQG